jgi:hypothetical protein
MRNEWSFEMSPMEVAVRYVAEEALKGSATDRSNVLSELAERCGMPVWGMQGQ